MHPLVVNCYGSKSWIGQNVFFTLVLRRILLLNIETVFRLAELIERDANVLANLETLDNGKPFLSAVGDIMASAATLKYYAGWCDKIHGNTIPAGD